MHVGHNQFRNTKTTVYELERGLFSIGRQSHESTTVNELERGLFSIGRQSHESTTVNAGQKVFT
jgi:hypothetical protein